MQLSSSEHPSRSHDAVIDISDDLLERSQRYKNLATENEDYVGHCMTPRPGSPSRTRKCPTTDPAVNQYMAAAYYVRDALSGSKTIPHIHTQQQMQAVKVARSRWMQTGFMLVCVLQVCCLRTRCTSTSHSCYVLQ